MKHKDVFEHFKQKTDWVDWDNTVDTFKFGNPDDETVKIAVGWQSTMDLLSEARELGCNLFITHEPTFYVHRDDDEGFRTEGPGAEKSAFLEQAGMTVLRCHDAWDTWPEIGIVDSWSRFLELGEFESVAKYYNFIDIPPVTAWEVTQKIARRVAELGQRSVEFTGTKHKIVNKVCVGTGAITNGFQMGNSGAEYLVLTDDGMSYWQQGSWLQDRDIPFCVVNHATAEIPGMKNLAVYLSEQFPDVETVFVGKGCVYTSSNTSNDQGIGVRMIQELDDEVGKPELPEGFELRDAREEDIPSYLEVMNDSIFFGNCADDWFDDEFRKDPDYDPVFVQIIWKDDVPAAAATAWHHDLDGEKVGKVHFVGVKKNFRNQGLGKAIARAVLSRIQKRGFSRVILDTQDWRLPAIRAYIKQGFKPYIKDDNTQKIWDIILANIKNM